jgi:hypothetical protein
MPLAIRTLIQGIDMMHSALKQVVEARRESGMSSSNVFSGEGGGPGKCCVKQFDTLTTLNIEYGTTLRLRIRHVGLAETKKKQILRESIPAPTLETAMAADLQYFSVQAGVGIFFQQENDGSVIVKTIVSGGSAEREGSVQVSYYLYRAAGSIGFLFECCQAKQSGFVQVCDF